MRYLANKKRVLNLITIISGFSILMGGMLIMRIRQVRVEKQAKLARAAWASTQTKGAAKT